MEAKLLLMLDFAGGVTDVLSQTLRLRFLTEDGAREHIPDSSPKLVPAAG